MGVSDSFPGPSVLLAGRPLVPQHRCVLGSGMRSPAPACPKGTSNITHHSPPRVRAELKEQRLAHTFPQQRTWIWPPGAGRGASEETLREGVRSV